ncbi:glutathione S-transferase N-terminal domain-containing protein [Gallionella capsiferriformans]|uniref:Glutathione S-transferase domain n=1 Tax=Gallionella capsiferriformans (strain ES-2) TaxID=395494 RepID=D9SHM2_GALCS|nr:glutathione S-transferase N-terminal domain-containing protein [Gallionella capsiferriformans]ADL54055.1 Glutathione S-transferase domain [Gallionella capsiferriformans ES-2]
MKLLGTHTSPYVRKARLVLLEKNIPHEYVIDPPSEPGSLVLQVNPLGRIPALILDDGFCVFDSSVIADYADTLNDAPVLIPRTDPLARLRVKRWEALADGIMDSAIVVRNESLRAEDKQSQAVLDMHNLAVTHALDYAAQLLGEREWCEGDAITLADLALVSALLYLDLRQAARDWRSAHANLAVWFSRISARPSVIVSNRL